MKKRSVLGIQVNPIHFPQPAPRPLTTSNRSTPIRSYTTPILIRNYSTPVRNFSSHEDYSKESSYLFSIGTFKQCLAFLGLCIASSIAFHSSTESAPLAYCQQRSPPPHDKNNNHSPNDKEKRSSRFNFIAEAVEKVAPSVVYIETSRRIPGHFGYNMASKSSGSGFVVENGQYVLTNAHVVSNSVSVSIKLNDGQVVQGEVTDMDEVADLAIIKMDLPHGVSLSPLKFGDSNTLRPGEWVVAMGSPLSLTNTITCGIVSSLHRASKDLGLGDRDMEYVQTDAAITIGNSGGPLVNLDGEVIGVNTMTAAPGISFAIPGNIAQNFVRSANKRATKKYKEPESSKKYMIGVSMLALDPHILRTIQQYFSISKEAENGILLTEVWPQSPAYVAGLRRGDVVVSINGKKINSTNDMYKMVRSGKALTIEYYRKYQFMSTRVVPEAIH